MAFVHSPKIVTDGLVLALDAGNVKSYPGSGTTWLDKSGRGNNGTLINGPTFSSANGGSIVFDGVNDIVLLPSNYFSWPSTTTWTTSIWFKSSQITGGPLFNQQDTTNPNSASGWVPVIYLRSDGKIRVEPFWTGNISNALVSNSAVNNNIWNLVTTTYNNGTNKLYMNGTYESQRIGLNQVNYTSTYYYLIGAGYSAQRGLSTNYFSGQISVFNFYNKSLTDTEILQNYNATKGRFGL
jgi:hypothetical protein